MMQRILVRRPARALAAAVLAGALLGWCAQWGVNRWTVAPQGLGIHRQVAPIYQAIRSHTHSVMLGDSLTHWGPWPELLPTKSVVNRGIAGDSIEKIAARLDAVYQLEPKVVFVMMGTNNLHYDVDVATVARRYEKVLQDLRAHQIEIIIQSTPLAGSQHSDSESFNQRVTQLNTRLKHYAETNQMRFLDLNAAMPDTDAYRLQDGIHFNAAAYARWATLVAPYMAERK